jgi:hypothetical protein
MMMGGEEALAPLKEPFTEKMKITLLEMVESERFKQASIFQSRHEPERRWYVINDSGSDGLGFID